MMSQKHKKILEEIVNSNGNCLDSKRCKKCPFARVCLVESLKNKKLPTKNKRFQMALEFIVNDIIMEDSNQGIENSEWLKKS